MKVRKGFVSNSSSSSFLCDVCGEMESGMDACLGDFDMMQCSKGHTFCNSHMKKPTIKEMRAALEEYPDEDSINDDSVEERYADLVSDVGCPPSNCPICTLKHVTDEVLIRFLLKKAGTTRKETVKEIQDTYKNLKELESVLGKK